MLQRAASNAYSWWWASHIRTKQSKWLEQSLQDMEEHVANALNLIQKDGDSFAKRAEMYYKHRPELIAFIEESVRAYRALAERYDKLSTDLQKANTTIASVFPDQLPYDTDYEDDDNDNNGIEIPKNIAPDPPKAPKAPESKVLKSLPSYGPKKNQANKVTQHHQLNHVPKSGLTKEEAIDEIDKLQKDILSMQTVKEFTKSSYENGFAKFSEIENKIIEMQQKVCDLQDEFKVVKGIEDDDARAIMAEAALKSCEESLAKLQEKLEKSSQDTILEHQRIQNAKKKFESIKYEYLRGADDDEEEEEHSRSQNSNESEQKEIEAKIRETLEELSKKSLTVTEMADTIDKLVNKVINLESLVSSQTVLINRLRIETDDLHTQILNLEDDKAKMIIGTHNLAKTFKDMEIKLNGAQDLGMNIDNQNNSLKMQFTEVSYNVKHLSENLHNMEPNEEVEQNEPSVNCEEITLGNSFPKGQNSTNDVSRILDEGYAMYDIGVPVNSVLKEEVEEKEVCWTNGDGEKNEKIIKEATEVFDEKKEDSNQIRSDNKNLVDDVPKPKDETNWQELLLGDLDDKEKVLLKEYTTILRKYKAAKKELAEEEQKNQGTVDEMKVQVLDLKTLLEKRDIEIQQMKRKLKLLQEDEGKYEMVDNKGEEDDIKSIFINKSEVFSEIEEKLRTDIDAILDENLDFWLRFSSTFHQVQKFETEVEDLQKEIKKVKTKGGEGKSNIRSEINAIYKHLKEIQTELRIWLEQSALLKNELQGRCLSLSNIHEEITTALRDGVEEEEIKFSTHQAAKFQGEVLNMQQENNRVNQELEAGLEHVTTLQVETEKTLKKLEEEFSLIDPNRDEKQQRLPSRSHIPLRSFIFGIKSKKQKPSIMGCINPHKKYTSSNSGSL